MMRRACAGAPLAAAASQRRWKLSNLSDEQAEYYRRIANAQDSFRPSTEVAAEKARLQDSRSLPAVGPGEARRDVGSTGQTGQSYPRGKVYFETSAWGGTDKAAKSGVDPRAPAGHSDEVKGSEEYDTVFGKYDMRPGRTGSVDDARYEGFHRPPPSWPTVGPAEVFGAAVPMHIGHHPNMDYAHSSGMKDGSTENMTLAFHTTDAKLNLHSLYRAARKSIALMKHYYMLPTPIAEMERALRVKFERNAHLRDPEAIRLALVQGWSEFNDTITFRKQRSHIFFFFGAQMKHVERAQLDFTKDKQRTLDERLMWEGHYNGRAGEYNETMAELRRLYDEREGRTPASQVATHRYFRQRVPDGTHAWERNQDYEGKLGLAAEPDLQIVRQTIGVDVDLSTMRPVHSLQKDRKRYRLQVAQLRRWGSASEAERYAELRDGEFNKAVTHERSLEMNRVFAEKHIAKRDDDVLTKQPSAEARAVAAKLFAEFPHPVQWGSEAFYLRHRMLHEAVFGYNWNRDALADSTAAAEAAWLADPVNFAIRHSAQYAALAADKARNPMARTWADFYAAFDPDDDASRRLPWVAEGFDYDRRHKWDERCMRKKKWLRSGDVDASRPFLQSVVHEWAQRVNSLEQSADPWRQMESKFTAPLMVQRYRAMQRVVDVALGRQMRAHMDAKGTLPKAAAANDAAATAAAAKAVEATDFSGFRFVPPTLVLADTAAAPAATATVAA